MGGVPTEALVALRNEWEIQILVVLSFTLQVFLFFFAGIRRYSVSSIVKILLWLVYLLADVTATYALGHLSSSTSPKHQLVGFWAPFLLLYLGGQDTITAYALEDNRLWLRHLLNLFLQVTSAAYVLYKYISTDGSLISATILVFAAGVVKYGERIWALKCASKKVYNPTRLILDTNRPYVSLEGLLVGGGGGGGGHFALYENVVVGAHCMLKVFMEAVFHTDGRGFMWHRGMYDDLWTAGKIESSAAVCGTSEEQVSRRAEIMYKITQLELSLVYDLVYTKAAVIHTRFGYCIRAISLVACMVTLVLFTTASKGGDGGRSYTTSDVATTYVLLIGASAMEIVSAVKMIGSSWTFFTLRDHNWVWLAQAILFVRHHLLVVKEGRWSNSVGQYNMLSFCSRGAPGLKGRIAKCVGLEDWWNRVQYTEHAQLSADVVELVFRTIEEKASRERTFEDGEPYIEGGAIYDVSSWHPQCKGFDGSEQFDESFSGEFLESVLVWHIATDVFLYQLDLAGKKAEHQRLFGAARILSEYMMHLLVRHPETLSIIPGNNLYDMTCASFTIAWRFFSKDNAKPSPHDMVLGYTECVQAEVAYFGDAVILKARRLVLMLMGMELDLAKTLRLISAVWVDMLCFTVNNAPGEFHLRQLGNGGEFLTQILLLAAHVGTVYQRNITCRLDLTEEEISHQQPVEVLVDSDDRDIKEAFHASPEEDA